MVLPQTETINIFSIDMLLKFLRRVYSTVYSMLSECLWKKIRTHDLLLTSADVLTSRPPSLPDDDRPARILYSSGFRNIHMLMKFLHRASSVVETFLGFRHSQA